MKLPDSLIENTTRQDAIENNLSHEEIFAKKFLENDVNWFLEQNGINTTQQGSSFTWSSYIRRTFQDEDWFYNDGIRIQKFKLGALYNALYGDQPDYKIINKILGKPKQYTINNTAGVQAYVVQKV